VDGNLGERRYVGINVTFYAKGEAVGLNRLNADNYSGGTGYLGKDIMGSVRGVINEYGQLEGRYEYDVFGVAYEGEMNRGMNLGYTGKPYDSATGLYNYGYRDYNPVAARFTSEDPVWDRANWFAYVNNDPVNWVDLWGLNASDSQTVRIDNDPNIYGSKNVEIRYFERNGTKGVEKSVQTAAGLDILPINNIDTIKGTEAYVK
jgi:RHS repeat-associated protein